ncbi:hypothetical protein U0070_008946 [Myodes glareolus]|uniref:Uncharacterized protein n=1 Tax=Myodes glareolus TaxID=447135 RepID=A0AAW0JN89_MYOGA
MPRYYEDKVEGGACAGVKEDLGACLLQSACVLQVARPGKELGDDWLPVGLRGRWIPDQDSEDEKDIDNIMVKAR